MGDAAKAEIPDTLESAVDEAIAICDGDMRTALRVALLYNTFLEKKLDSLRGLISRGYTRGKIREAPGHDKKSSPA